MTRLSSRVTILTPGFYKTGVLFLSVTEKTSERVDEKQRRIPELTKHWGPQSCSKVPFSFQIRAKCKHSSFSFWGVKKKNPLRWRSKRRNKGEEFLRLVKSTLMFHNFPVCFFLTCFSFTVFPLLSFFTLPHTHTHTHLSQVQQSELPLSACLCLFAYSLSQRLDAAKRD